MVMKRSLYVLPFLLALLYFWTDMSWSAVAFQHRAETSLGVALLFLWMKSCQTVFCRKLRGLCVKTDSTPVNIRSRCGSMKTIRPTLRKTTAKSRR